MDFHLGGYSTKNTVICLFFNEMLTQTAIISVNNYFFINLEFLHCYEVQIGIAHGLQGDSHKKNRWPHRFFQTN
jgi:hypothetical protein